MGDYFFLILNIVKGEQKPVSGGERSAGADKWRRSKLTWNGKAKKATGVRKRGNGLGIGRGWGCIRGWRKQGYPDSIGANTTEVSMPDSFFRFYYFITFLSIAKLFQVTKSSISTIWVFKNVLGMLIPMIWCSTCSFL